MATLRVEAQPTDGVRQYRLVIDAMSVPMRPDDKGAIAVHGKCGDGSPHVLNYVVIGKAGEKLSIRILCDGKLVGDFPNIEIFPVREPYASGSEDFFL